MADNSMRDEMKDGIREILAHYFKIDPFAVDADCVCSIADVAFAVCGISDREQDAPVGDHNLREGEKPDLYSVQLKETNGEQEYSHDLLITAGNDHEAWHQAHHLARHWYAGDGEEVHSNQGQQEYAFFGGARAVRIARVEKTTKEEWVKRQYEAAVIHPVYR
jgi:hypothetical protein